MSLIIYFPKANMSINVLLRLIFVLQIFLNNFREQSQFLGAIPE